MISLKATCTHISRRWWLSAAATLLALLALWAVNTTLAQGPVDRQIRPQDALNEGGQAANGVGNFTLAPAAPVGSAISYQGALNENGQPVNGTRNMIFRLYSDAACTTQVGSDIVRNGVSLTNGFFSVELDINQADFNGQALWLKVEVEGTGLGCQKILSAPYALSLRPGARTTGPPSGWSGAVISTSLEGGWPAASAVAGVNPATGTAGRFESATGYGVFGYSGNTYGVWGLGDNSWGGYFTSQQGYGIRVDTNGTDHWDHAGYFTSEGGYGLYAQSTGNMAIRGEAGNVSGLGQPVGHVGVVGIGQSRGVYGSSDSSYGMYGTSLNWYGIYGRTSRTDNNYGIYTSDNFYSLNVNMAGAIMHVAQNGGREALEPGNVVVFSGIGAPLEEGNPPVAQVSKATAANSPAVAGVVYRRFNVEAVKAAEADEQGFAANLEVTPAGPVQPGDYLLLVV